MLVSCIGRKTGKCVSLFGVVIFSIFFTRHVQKRSAIFVNIDWMCFERTGVKDADIIPPAYQRHDGSDHVDISDC